VRRNASKKARLLSRGRAPGFRRALSQFRPVVLPRRQPLGRAVYVNVWQVPAGAEDSRARPLPEGPRGGSRCSLEFGAIIRTPN